MKGNFLFLSHNSDVFILTVFLLRIVNLSHNCNFFLSYYSVLLWLLLELWEKKSELRDEKFELLLLWLQLPASILSSLLCGTCLTFKSFLRGFNLIYFGHNCRRQEVSGLRSQPAVEQTIINMCYHWSAGARLRPWTALKNTAVPVCLPRPPTDADASNKEDKSALHVQITPAPKSVQITLAYSCKSHHFDAGPFLWCSELVNALMSGF